MTRPFDLGAVRVEPAANEIIIAGARKRVRRKLMQALLYLARQDGRVVERRDLMDHIWGERAVSDESLTQLISELRRTLSAAGAAGPQLETVSGRGYRLRLPVPLAAAPSRTDPEEAMRASDRRWGFALLLALLVSVQLTTMLTGIGHH
jgi:DNA-binding winged helix-turn-helix (wHTH) protein